MGIRKIYPNRNGFDGELVLNYEFEIAESLLETVQAWLRQVLIEIILKFWNYFLLRFCTSIVADIFLVIN